MSGGSSFTTFTLSAATWVKIRCRWNSGPTISCENRPLRAPLHHLPTRLQPERARLAEDEADHQALAAHLVEELVLLDKGNQALHEGLAGHPRPVDDVLVVDRLQRGERRHHGELVAPEGRGVDDGALHLRVDTVEDLRRAHHRPDRDIAAREGLGHRDDVGAQAVVLVSPQLSGPAETRSGPRR